MHGIFFRAALLGAYYSTAKRTSQAAKRFSTPVLCAMIKELDKTAQGKTGFAFYALLQWHHRRAVTGWIGSKA
jgi:hypothetical protein